jgi:hypothetical protein
MQYAIVAGTWASFSRTVVAAAIGSWLAFAICPAVFAADGPQAAAAAKEAAAKLQAYLRDLKKSKGQPDYSKPPASEYLNRIFDADTLADLPPPKAEDLAWLFDWIEAVGHTFPAMVMFGAKDQSDAGWRVALARNMPRNHDTFINAMASGLRLCARTANTEALFINSMAPDKRTNAIQTAQKEINLELMNWVMTTTMFVSDVKPENSRLLAAALRDTVPVWAPIVTPQERTTILTQLGKARMANKNAGIDDDIDAVETAMKNVKD